MNWIVLLVVGGVIGWLASILMKTNAQMGLIANIIVGIVGSALGGWLATRLGIAQGGAMALEDAAVLAELLLTHDVVDQRMWDAFTARRLPRAKTVVDASNQLAQWLIDHERGDVPSLMRRIAALVSQPA